MASAATTVKTMSEHMVAAVVAVVKEHMAAQEMSTYKLIQKSKLPKASVHRWLDGRSAVGLNDLAKIADALDTTVVALIGEAEPRARRLDRKK